MKLIIKAFLKARSPAVVALLSGYAYAYAAYEGPMRFMAFWPCDGNSSVCATRVLAEGVIESGSASKLEAFLSIRRPRGDELPPAPTIAFDSPGGSVSGGVLLGTLIRARKMDTALAPTYERVNKQKKEGYESFLSGARCASACVLAFAGGVRREVEVGSRMGVHQFSGADHEIGDAATQVTVVHIASFLKDMGVKRELLDIASLIPASSVYWLKPEEVKLTRLDNTAAPVSRWALNATLKGEPTLAISQEISTGKHVRVVLMRAADRILVAFSSGFDKRFFAEDRLGGFPVGAPECVSLVFGNGRVEPKVLNRWVRIETERTTAFRCIGSVSLAQAQALARAASFALDDDFPRAIRDLSINATLGTEDFAEGMALLLRAN